MFTDFCISVPLLYHFHQKLVAFFADRWRPMAVRWSEFVWQEPGTPQPSKAMTKSAIAPANLRWLTTEEARRPGQILASSGAVGLGGDDFAVPGPRWWVLDVPR